MKKRSVFIALTICLLMLLGTTAFAADVMPLWDNTAKCTPCLNINGTTANCTLDVVAINTSCNITATVILQKENSRGNYTNVKSWPGLSSTGSLRFFDSYTVSTGVKYRLRADVTVTDNKGTDDITVYAY